MDKKEELKVVSINKGIEEEESYLIVRYSDGNSEALDADQFGMSRDIDNFLAFWKENPYNLLTFINATFVQKVDIVIGKFKK